MAENILRKLVNNSQMAIDDGVYEIDADLQKSSKDFKQIIQANAHATLLTEIKFSSPSLGKIRTLTDPASIARQMMTVPPISSFLFCSMCSNQLIATPCFTSSKGRISH